MLQRYRRKADKKDCDSFLLDPPIRKVNFLYLKGISMDEMMEFAQRQRRKPIFVTSIIFNQRNPYIPRTNDKFYCFAINDFIYSSLNVNILSYLLALRKYRNELLTPFPILPNQEILPVNSTTLNFDEAGSMAHALIKYGCRLVFGDKSFEKKKAQYRDIFV